MAGEVMKEEMDIHRLAEKYRVRTKRDECGETFIPGKAGQI